VSVSPLSFVRYRDLIADHREEEWRISLLDRQDREVRTLDNVRGGTFEASIFNTIRTGGSLDYTGEPLDWNAYRVQPWYILRDPLTQEITSQWPIGVFIASTPRTAYDDGSQAVTVDLYDKLLLLDQDKVEQTYSVEAGTNPIEAVAALVASVGETRVLADDFEETLPADKVWPVGTSKLRIANDLLKAANFFSLWVDGFGVFRLHKYRAADARETVWEFLDDEAGIYSPKFTHEEDGFNVPNKVIVIGIGDAETEAPSAYALNEDPDSPWSYQGRNERWIAYTEEGVEATSTAVLAEIAQRRLLELSQTGSTFSVSHAPIPLALNDIVRFRHRPSGTDARAVVQSVSLSMDVGALSTIRLREVT